MAGLSKEAAEGGGRKAERERSSWYRSFYWRIGVGFVACVIAVFVAQSVIFSLMTARPTGMPGGMPGRSPNSFAAMVAADVESARRPCRSDSTGSRTSLPFEEIALTTGAIATPGFSLAEGAALKNPPETPDKRREGLHRPDDSERGRQGVGRGLVPLEGRQARRSIFR